METVFKSAPVSLLLCGLLALSACSDSGDPAEDAPDLSVSSWELFDRCDDGLGIRVRFFEQNSTTGQLTGFEWPGPDQLYTTTSGGEVSANLNCDVGTRICFGADAGPSSSFTWGIGTRGNQSCSDCCFPCGVDESANLVCS